MHTYKNIANYIHNVDEIKISKISCYNLRDFNTFSEKLNFTIYINALKYTFTMMLFSTSERISSPEDLTINFRLPNAYSPGKLGLFY